MGETVERREAAIFVQWRRGPEDYWHTWSAHSVSETAASAASAARESMDQGQRYLSQAREWRFYEEKKIVTGRELDL